MLNGLVNFGIAEGNPGALTFIMEAYVEYDPFKAEQAFRRMWRAGVMGSRLYMLWNDCCKRKTEMAIDVMLNKDIDVILHHIDDGNGYGIPFQEETNEQE